MGKYKKLLSKISPVILIVIIVVFGGRFLKNEPLSPKINAPIALPQGGVCDPETLTCTDGTTVKKQGPNCDFPPCPSLAASSSAVFHGVNAKIDR